MANKNKQKGSAGPAAITQSTACFKLTLELLSDLHAGSGLGGAGVDALIARDSRGKPVIRWSHHKGLLAQVCRDYYDDLGKSAEGVQMAEKLFGKEGRTRDARGLVVGTSLRFVAGGNRETIVRASTAMETDERRPLDDTLRRVEFVGAGAKFESEIRLPHNKETTDFFEFLLNRLDRLGGDRSRGSGLVFLARCEKSILNGQVPKPNETPPVRPLRLLLKTLEPLCLAATGKPDNLIPTHSHLSSTTVQGMFTRWALDHGQNELADAFLEGRIQPRAAYPVPDFVSAGDIAKLDVVPIPLARQTPKPPGQSGERPWWAGDSADPVPSDTLVESPQAKLKRPGSHDYLFTQDGGKAWQVFHCPTHTTLHNDAGSSRKNQRDQKLYSVQEIAAGTGFVLELQGDADSQARLEKALEKIKDWTSWLRVGRGGAPVQLVAVHASANGATSTDADSVETPDGSARSVRIFVESDLILRAPDFSFHTRLDANGLRALLADAGIAPDKLDSFHCTKQVSEDTPVHGWNIATRRPRLVAVAIRRGSEVVVDCEDAELLREARRLLLQRASSGFGERCREGYGRLRIDFAPTIVPNASPRTITVPINSVEAQLRRIQNAIGEPGFPRAFTPSRWQGLYSSAGHVRSRNAWFAAAEREIGEAHNGHQQQAWISLLSTWNADDLAVLGRIAAKRKGASSDECTTGAEE